jgi:Tfp pilus assembly protein FimT
MSVFGDARKVTLGIWLRVLSYSYHWMTMKPKSTKELMWARTPNGSSLIEVLIVVAIGLVVAAIAVPMFEEISYSIRLRSAATSLSGMMQQARILAEKKNAINTIVYRNNGQQAYVDLNLNGQWDVGEPIITFVPSIRPAAGAPNGAGGQPTPYVLVGDTGNVSYDNATTLGYSPRGLPCAYAAGTCNTPANGYFTYYLRDQRPGGNVGWAVVVVSRSGRSKTSQWSGTAWQ